MAHRTLPIRPFAAVLLALLPAAAPAEGEGSEIPGFVNVPEGRVFPGTNQANIKARALNPELLDILQYERWGDLEEGVVLPEYSIQRFEVTNAQWKHYLDANFRRDHVTNGMETLEAIASQYVRLRGEAIPSEWEAIFAFNMAQLERGFAEHHKAAALAPGEDPADQPLEGEDDAEEEEGKPAKPKRVVLATWEELLKDPKKFGKARLPKGIKLVLYAHRTPRHWIAWCPYITVLPTGVEYCEIRKDPVEAFKVPEGEIFAKIRAKDFAAFPIRSVSTTEVFAFAEWAGCHLPSEYEYERAGKGDQPLTVVHTMRGAWDHNKQKHFFAWADNPACIDGPLAVDDSSVQPGDSAIGCRHLIGNVGELTRTFYDYHPYLTAKPAAPALGLFNYSLVMKSASWGDSRYFMQLSTRTGVVGKGDTSLQSDNRFDTLGFRLVRHPRAGWDMLLHTTLRVSYSPGTARWGRYSPQAFALAHMAGVDTAMFEAGVSPYVHAKKGAKAIATAPLWFSTIDDTSKRKIDRAWSQKSPVNDYEILGLFRSDVALRGGVRLSNQDRAALEEWRKKYEEYKKKSKDKPKKGDPPLEVVEPPPAPDEYETRTAPFADVVGLWREKRVEPGEWYLVYWNGFLGLANKALVMPPEAIFLLDARSGLARQSGQARPASLTLDAAKDTITITMHTEEQIDSNKPQGPPDHARNSDLWALCETLTPNWTGWPGRKPGRYVWILNATLNTEKGALQAHEWNR